MNLPFLHKKNKEEVTHGPALSLTKEGRNKAERIKKNEPEYEILFCLMQNGTLSIGELAKNTGISRGDIQEAARKLMAEGLIRRSQ